MGVFGGGVGDLISSIPAFKIWIGRLQERFDEVIIDIFAHGSIQSLFDNSRYFFGKVPAVRFHNSLPISLGQLNSYDAFLDTSFFMQDKKSQELSIVDFSLYKLGIDHTTIPNEQKLLPLASSPEITPLFGQYIDKVAKDKTIVLFHPNSSTAYRSIPKEFCNMLLHLMLDDESIFVLSVNNFKDFKHPRFLDMSHLSLSLEHLFSIVDSVDFCVSSDTAIYHIAQGFGKGAIVFFTTIAPRLRIPYYDRRLSDICRR